MLLFFDTNVAIGYVFNGDMWNTQAKNIFKCPNQKYYSDNVLKEIERKIKIISKEINVALLFISAEILKYQSKDDQLTLDDTLKFINSLNLVRRLNIKTARVEMLKKYISILFSTKYAYDINKNELSKDIKQESNNFRNEYNTNFNFIQTVLKKHNKKHNHDNLKRKLLDSDKDFHIDDVKIILDAHDLGITQNPLTYVTADSKRNLNAIIIKNTNIDNVKDLREFFIFKCP